MLSFETQTKVNTNLHANYVHIYVYIYINALFLLNKNFYISAILDWE